MLDLSNDNITKLSYVFLVSPDLNICGLDGRRHAMITSPLSQHHSGGQSDRVRAVHGE